MTKGILLLVVVPSTARGWEEYRMRLAKEYKVGVSLCNSRRGR